MGKPPSSYTKEYFLTALDARVRAIRLSKSFNMANLRSGMTILDIGCGMGEIVINCGLRGSMAIGVDFSLPALELAKEALVHLLPKSKKSCDFIKADARNLPFRDRIFDRIFLIDLIEHLYQPELKMCIKDTYRVLATNGVVVIHTSPNAWYIKLYPLLKFLSLFIADNQSRELLKPARGEFHVNEQSIFSLRKVLKDAGFHCVIKSEFDERRLVTFLESLKVRVLNNILRFLFKKSSLALLGNHIYAIATPHQ